MKRHRVIFDTSRTGSGKSESLLNCFRSNLSSDNTLISKSVKELRSRLVIYGNALILEGRRGSYVDEQRNTDIPATCQNFEKCNHIVNKGYKDLNLCKECLYKDNCEFMKMQKSRAANNNHITTSQMYAHRIGEMLYIDECSSVPLFIIENIKINDVQENINILNQSIHASTYKIPQSILIALRDCLNDYVLYINQIENEDRDELTQILLKLQKYINKIKNIPIKYLQELYYNCHTSNYRKMPEFIIERFINLLTNPDVLGLSIDNNKTLSISYVNPFWIETVERLNQNLIKFLYIMDATPDKFLMDFLRKNSIDFDIVCIENQRDKPHIVQICDYANSKSYFNLNQKDKAFIKKTASTNIGKIGIITFADKKAELLEFLKETGMIDRFVIGHWGFDNRATNKFNDCNTLIVFGKFIKSPADVEREAYLVNKFISDEISCDTMTNFKFYNDGSGGAVFRKYDNPINNQFFQNEMKQCIGRVGRGNNDLCPKIYVITNEPLDIEIDERLYYRDLLEYEEYASEKQIAQKEKSRNNADELNLKLQECCDRITARGEKLSVERLRKESRVGKSKAQEFLKGLKKKTSPPVTI